MGEWFLCVSRQQLITTKILTDIDLPDLTDADNVVYLERWDGTWAYLCTLKWVRITKEGVVHKSSFPPKGKS